jgi:hypothetical protein
MLDSSLCEYIHMIDLPEPRLLPELLLAPIIQAKIILPIFVISRARGIENYFIHDMVIWSQKGENQ